ncbi:MAG: hypoxanthine phosphoribosyltransferase, partial [Gammaproteobacteria bacterium]|nr:hypoxanthine phosphoribosyltransferase [Gammaproteobacteria bacterium]
VINELATKARRNLPQDIKTATVWYRPTERTVAPPDFYVHETQDWLILPYELSGLSLQELREHKPELAGVMDRLEELVAATQGSS